MIVADTNVITYLLLQGDSTPEAERAFQRDPEWAAPLLWRSEFRNVLAHYIRLRRLSLSQALQLAEQAELLMSGREFSVASPEILTLASDSRCSAYDCEFVALARQLGVSLVTSDQAILEAFAETAVSLEAFGARRPRGRT